MISLDKYRKKKEKNEFKDKLLQHRLVILYRTVLVIITVVAIALGTYITLENKTYSDYEVISDEERQDADSAEYIAYDNAVMKYSQDGAEAFDGSNKAIWNETFELQDPIVATGGQYTAIGDYKGNIIYVMNSLGEQASIETKLPLSTFCISEQGVVAAVLEEDAQSWINLYSSTGEVLVNMKCTMTQSGYPVDIALSNDGMKLGVSYMRIDQGELKSSVAFYNFDDVGQNEIDKYVSGYDYADTIMPKIKFINNSTAFALGDDHFVIYKGSQKPTSYFDTFLTEEVQSVFYGDKSVALIFRTGEATDKYRIDVYDEDGKLGLSQKFSLDYTNVALKGNQITIYNDSKCLIYKMNGTLKYEGALKEPTLLMVPTENNTKYILVNRDSVQLIRLH